MQPIRAHLSEGRLWKVTLRLCECLRALEIGTLIRNLTAGPLKFRQFFDQQALWIRKIGRIK
ncbi:MAG: hypothetical protein C4519_07550 [Desulfobacteraceae bacterium]|nr:MAG: hypothetical protein C4519_07550 [Desulfobacteraceae bacterium]